MRFYDQYAKICEKQGIEPCSQRAAEMFGVTRATISTWNSRDKAPMGETVKIIADSLGVSTDYLLCRTDDPTDYSNPDLIAEVAGPVLDEFNGDVEKAVVFQKAVAADVKAERSKRPHILDLYDRLDRTDRIRVEAYIEGMLTGDKYKTTDGKRAAVNE